MDRNCNRGQKSGREKHTLVFPKHWFDPEHWLTFVQMDGFSDDWDDLGLSDEDLRALEIMLMSRPKAAPVVPGTGALRKARFAPLRWSKGKRGAIRVLYAFFEEFGIVLLIAAYSKNEIDDFPAPYKKAYKELLRRQKAEFAKRAIE